MFRGVEAFVKELISRLVDSDKFEIHLFSDYESSSEKINFNCCKIIKREKLYFIDKFPKILRRLMNIINIGSSADIEALSMYVNLLIFNKKENFDIIVPLGGYWTYKLASGYSSTVIGIGQSGVVKKWLKLSDFFVALTPFDLEKVKKTNPKIAAILIPNGVDISKFNIENRNSNIKIILCVAALVEDKRHECLFNAVMHLPENIHLKCVGAGSLKDNLMRHPLFLAGRVHFESISYDKISIAYSEADIFTLASKSEAFGIAFIEALASGLPVVSHDGPRQRYVLGDNGIFCNTDNSLEYADSLKIALIMNKSSNCREYVQRKFSWDRVSNQYIELFKKVNKSLN